MSKMKEKYLQEYEKYRHVKIEHRKYKLKSNGSIIYEILDISEDKDKAIIKSVASGMERERTLHWCRKNLEPVGSITNWYSLVPLVEE